MAEKRVSTEAVYPIGVASHLLGLHPRTLRIYEMQGLLFPGRRGNKRYYSNKDLAWIRCIRELIHEDRIGIRLIQQLLELPPCWEVRDCPAERAEACQAMVDPRVPCWKLAQWACPSEAKSACAECEMRLRADEVISNGKNNKSAKNDGVSEKVVKRPLRCILCDEMRN